MLSWSILLYSVAGMLGWADGEYKHLTRLDNTCAGLVVRWNGLEPQDLTLYSAALKHTRQHYDRASMHLFDDQDEPHCSVDLTLNNAHLSTRDKHDAIERDDKILGAYIAKHGPSQVVILLAPPGLQKRQVTSVPYVLYANRAIFNQYVFLNPALYMGIFSSLILLVITYGGISILAGLQTPTRFDTYKKTTSR